MAVSALAHLPGGSEMSEVIASLACLSVHTDTTLGVLAAVIIAAVLRAVRSNQLQ